MANAKRPSVHLTEKRNVNPSVNRQTEVTAEDFKEIAEILDDHADFHDAANLNPEKFYRFHSSLATLAAAYPNAVENGWAVIIPTNGNVQFVATFENGQWIASENEAPIQFFNTIAERDLVENPQEGIWYIVKDEKVAYLWYNNKWNGFGKDGNNGISAYQVAVARGFVGTEDEWLESLRGKSAYQVAQANGFQGTEEEWIQSLVGPPGTELEIPAENGKIPVSKDGSIDWQDKPTGNGLGSNSDKGDFVGELDVSGGNNFYNDYLGDALDINISNNKSLGSTSTVRIQGGKINSIPGYWNFSGEDFSENEFSFNELSVMYVRDNDVRIVNRIVPIPDNENPTAASNLRTNDVSANSISLAWDAGSDNVGIDYYEIFVDNNSALNTTELTAIISNLEALTTYSLFVRTYDASGNYSDSASIDVDTNDEVLEPEFAVYKDFVKTQDSGNGLLVVNDTLSGGWNAGAIVTKAINGDNAFVVYGKAGENQMLVLTNQFGSIGVDDFNSGDYFFTFKDGNTLAIGQNGTKIAEPNWNPAEPVIFRVSGTTLSVEHEGATIFTLPNAVNLPLSAVGLFNSNQDAELTVSFEHQNNLITSTVTNND